MFRGLWIAVAGFLAVSLLGCATMATGSGAVGPSPGPVPGPPSPAANVSAPPEQVRVLQLNLCNSGIASCYTGGRSIDEAAELIRAETPDLVTLNEICDGDVSALERAMADAVSGGEVGSAFQAARDGTTGEAYRCRNGQQFGIGIVSRWPSEPESGIYPTQDPEDPEQRAWLCLDVADPALSACTTHLAYTDRDVTIAQCGYLFDTVIAEMRARDGAAPAVMGADLNIGSGSSDLESCLPGDSAFVDDGKVQHVVATPEFVVDSYRTIDMNNTDHPGLLVRLTSR